MGDGEGERKKRRRLRTAPKERPVVRVTKGFEQKIVALGGERLGKEILAAFENGELPGGRDTFVELEQKLETTAQREVVHKVLEAVLEEIHGHEDFVRWSMAEARRRHDEADGRLRATDDRRVMLRTPGGTTEVLTPYMRPRWSKEERKQGRRRSSRARKEVGNGLYPVLGALGFICRVSPYVASLAARRAAQLASFEETAATLSEQGIELDPDTIRRITLRVADVGLCYREETDAIEPVFVGKRVVLAVDGGRIRCREEKVGRRRKSGYHGYETPWKEPKVLAAYTVNEKGEQIRTELLVKI